MEEREDGLQRVGKAILWATMMAVLVAIGVGNAGGPAIKYALIPLAWVLVFGYMLAERRADR